MCVSTTSMIQVALFLGCINRKVFEGVDDGYLMTLYGALRRKTLSLSQVPLANTAHHLLELVQMPYSDAFPGSHSDTMQLPH